MLLIPCSGAFLVQNKERVHPDPNGTKGEWRVGQEDLGRGEGGGRRRLPGPDAGESVQVGRRVQPLHPRVQIRPPRLRELPWPWERGGAGDSVAAVPEEMLREVELR
jgi:hypothetical protein